MADWVNVLSGLGLPASSGVRAASDLSTKPVTAMLSVWFFVNDHPHGTAP